MKFARIVTATACAFALLPPHASFAATRAVDIPGRYFAPQRVTVTVGSAVRWTNSSSNRHSVTAMASSSDRFTSSDNCPGGILGFNDCLAPGATYQHTFSRTGTFDYFCKIHGNEGSYPDCGMCGRVTVKRKGGGIVPTTPGSSSPTSSATSPSPSPSISETSVTSPTGTNVAAAAPDEGTSTSTLLAIAALAVALLGGTGIVVYRTMIRR
jgi:plastocyanin